MTHEISGDKYIYVVMAYQLAKLAGGHVKIGNDNGYIGGDKFARYFNIMQHNTNTILQETKGSRGGADFSRYFRVEEGKSRIFVYTYYNEYAEDCNKRWEH